MKRTLLYISFLFFGNISSQNDNEIDPVEIKIVKDYNVFIEEATKIHTPISYYPKFKDKANQKKLSYSIPDRIEQFKFEPTSVEPIDYKSSSFHSFNDHNFLKLGFGSALNPIVEWSHIQSKSKLPSRIHLFHHSSWLAADSFQKYSETKAEATWDKSIKQWQIQPKIFAQHKLYNFYGNLTESNNKSSAYRNYSFGGISLRADRKNTKLNSLYSDYLLKFNYGLESLHMGDSTYKNNESNISFDSKIGYNFRENIKLLLRTNVTYYHLAFDTFTDKWLFQGMPAVEYKHKGLKLNAGLNLVQSLVNSKGVFYIFPNVYSEIQLIPNYVNFYTNWSREIELNRLNTTIQSNPYILYTNKELLPNTRIENRAAGIKGMYQGVIFHAFFNQKIMKDALIYKNDSINPRFLISHIEQNLTASNICLEISYLKEKKWSAYVKGEIFLYELDQEPKIAYNLPAQKLAFGVHTSIIQRVNLSLNAFALGGVKSVIQGQVITNPILFDLNLGSEFHISKNFYIFANVNNILNSKIAPQIGFPTIGFNGQAGVKINY